MTKARWEDDPALRRIRIEGDLDHVGCEKVGSAVREAVGECPARRVVIDLSAVTFIASKGISLLIEARKKVVATGRSLVIEGLAPQVRRALDTIGFLSAYPECVGVNAP
jgi:anti-anti-sigma factor